MGMDDLLNGSRGTPRGVTQATDGNHPGTQSLSRRWPTRCSSSAFQCIRNRTGHQCIADDWVVIRDSVVVGMGEMGSKSYSKLARQDPECSHGT